eukprot:TRINITY_DN9482_c0_g1_i1.p1 TRINITY_DN9482_c0_g1~~TRINITY_DN9482_c0_g1_i1.p1  ORF type:complete len:498 (-),score=164.73 TRINITY_DN9482_c0_g1_i1:134-1627(-)
MEIYPDEKKSSKFNIKILNRLQMKHWIVIGGILVMLLILLSFIVVGVPVVFSVLSNPDEETSKSEETETNNDGTIIEDDGGQIDDWEYGVIVDLGSSGSRLSIYNWKKNQTEFVQPAPYDAIEGDYWYYSQRPGVSQFAEDPEAAGPNLKNLLNNATYDLNSINVNISNVPIFLYATAGLRLLEDYQSQAILESIRNYVKSNYDFYFQDDYCRIISGTEESVFDWLSVQQILFLHDAWNSNTFGILDMGGGSTEFTMFPKNSEKGNVYDQDDFIVVEYQNHDYDCYAYSYLDYGHNEARDEVQQLIVDDWEVNQYIGPNPCMLYNDTEIITLKDKNGEDHDYTFNGTGLSQECDSYIEKFINKTPGDCPYEFCSIGNNYQPKVSEYSSFVALDNLPRVVNGFFQLGTQPKLDSLNAASNSFCTLSLNQAIEEHTSVGSEDEFIVRNYCFEGRYAYKLLTYGFGFDSSSQQILFSDPLYGVDISWTLGAMINNLSEIN